MSDYHNVPRTSETNVWMKLTVLIMLVYLPALFVGGLRPYRLSHFLGHDVFPPVVAVLGAFLVAGRSPSVFPFAVFAVVFVGLDMGIGFSYSGRDRMEDLTIRSNLGMTLFVWGPWFLLMILACCGAAKFRQWIDAVLFPPPRLICTKCGYSLVGLTEARCPECGSAFSESILREARTAADVRSDAPE